MKFEDLAANFAGHPVMKAVQPAWKLVQTELPYQLDVFEIRITEMYEMDSETSISYTQDAKEVRIRGEGHLWDPTSKLTRFGQPGTRVMSSTHFTNETDLELNYLRQLRVMFGRDYYEKNAKFELFCVTDGQLELHMNYSNGDGTEDFRDLIFEVRDGAVHYNPEWPRPFDVYKEVEMLTRRIVRNAARCLKCQDVIESRHVRDFVSCRCGAIFTDGGLDYVRRGGNVEDMEDMSVYE